MKIDAVRIRLFGKLANKDFGPISPGLTVCYGENESGKTTLKEFIRTTLFKTSERKKGVYPQTSNTDSGEIDCITDSEKKFTIKRDGNKISSDIEKMPSDISGVDPETYRNIYAMNPEDLINTNLVESGDIKRRFLTVPGGENMPQISAAIDSEMEELLNTSRITYNKGIGEIIDKIDKNEKLIASAKTKGIDYNDLVEKEARLEATLKTLREKQIESNLLKAIIKSYEDQMKLVKEYNDLVEKRKEMNDAEKAPSEGMDIYHGLNQTLKITLEKKEINEKSLEKLKDGLGKVSLQALGHNVGRIQTLNENIGTYRSAIEKSSEHETNIDTLNSKISQLMTEAKLNDDTVENADTSEEVIQRAKKGSDKKKNYLPTALMAVLAIISFVAAFIAGITLVYAVGAIFAILAAVIMFYPLRDKNDDFSEYVASKGFPVDTLRENVVALCSKIDEVRSLIGQRDTLVSKERELDDMIALFDLKLKIVAEKVGIERVSFEDDVRKLQSMATSAPGLSEATETLEDSINKYNTAVTAVDRYLSSYGSIEELERIVQLKKDRDAIDGKMATMKEVLETAGIELDSEPPTTPEDFNEEIESLQRGLGSIGNKKSAILKDADTERLYNERSALQAELDAMVLDWGVLSLQKYISDFACDDIYDNMQPRVIQTADLYLDMMTNGKYHMDNDPRTKDVSIRGGTEVKSKEMWSSGLAGQVCLSLKLAMAKELSDEKLPILLDDVLLVFDSERKMGACLALAEVAKETQIILFTCDRETYEFMKQVGSDIIEMGI